ncbi:hypothetical protein DENSPDRAFT_933016 [Dentipellis sp. KUC8613]|nr:hypothetical protein DENSPDRAFT_933016 [Dentipellis sp. KUC8613]
MSIIPGLNDDCVIRTLHFMDTSSLSSMAATSRAALLLARPLLVRDVCLESDAQATSFLIMVIIHSLEHAMRTLCLAIGNGIHATPWPVLLGDVLTRTPRLTRLELWPPRRYPRSIFDSLVNYTPTLTQLCIQSLDIEGATALQSVRGLSSVSLGMDIQRVGRGEYAAMSRMVSAIITGRGNADTLQDVTLFSTINSSAIQTGEVRFIGGGAVCPRVARLTIHHISFDLADVARCFPNVQRLETCQSLAPVDSLDEGVPWPKLTTLVAPQSLVVPMLAHSDCPLLRCLVVRTHYLDLDLRINETLDGVRVFDSIQELSLAIPARDPDVGVRDSAAAFLWQVLGSVPNVQKLDLSVNFERAELVNLASLTPDTKPRSYTLDELAYLSLTIDVRQNAEDIQDFAAIWFTSCPNLTHIRLHAIPDEYRWKRHAAAFEGGSLLNIAVASHCHNSMLTTIDDEVSAFGSRYPDL